MSKPPAFHIMTKPIGPLCNLACKYCFYLEKERLYPGDESFRMPEQVLERFIRDYIAAQDVPEVSFAWQGGEPTLLGVGFFQKVVALQERYADGKQITNAFQTNGILLDDPWCEFLAANRFLIGLSIDGPRALHDTYRVSKGGQPSFDKVMRGLDFLQRHRVEYNTLTVVNDVNSRQPAAVYRFLKETGAEFLQFIPLVERLPGRQASVFDLAEPPAPGKKPERAPVTEWSVRPPQYGEFLVTIFEEWVRQDVGRTFVQIFDVALANWLGVGSPLCVFAEHCGNAMALEHNGDLYACDHYVYPQYKLGNIMADPLAALAGSDQQRRFGADKTAALPKYCRECEVRFACNGECPKHRFLTTPTGEPGLNYLCAAYKRFFRHLDPYMKTMARLIAMRRAPAEIMAMVAARDAKEGGATGQPTPTKGGGRTRRSRSPAR